VDVVPRFLEIVPSNTHHVPSGNQVQVNEEILEGPLKIQTKGKRQLRESNVRKTPKNLPTRAVFLLENTISTAKTSMSTTSASITVSLRPFRISTVTGLQNQSVITVFLKSSTKPSNP
jgi:hypothetical protein